MSKITRFDAHCHIFTIRFVLLEAKRMLHDMFHNLYPWERPEAMAKSRAPKDKIEDFKQFLRWLIELTSAALISERHNLNFLIRHGKKAFPNNNFSVIPLMMDVYYIFSYPLDKDQDLPGASVTQCELSQENNLQELWEEIIGSVREHLVNLFGGPSSASGGGNILNELLKLVDQERFVIPVEKNKLTNQVGNEADYYHTEGFDHHMNKLMDLVRTRRGDLYPFVAVDPRRPGMIDTVLSGKFFKGNPRFYGVKLYPRLGYHPQCKPLMPLYKYCSDNNLPITFHCGMSGFPPGIDWKWAHFGDPANFEPIVQQFPNLRINFAHMGSNDPDHNWEKTISTLVSTYPNVYTDLSCYTSKTELQDMLTYFQTNSKLENQLMYGSDFDVMYFTGNKINMNDYIDNFKDVFPNYLNAMMIDNPKSFLGVEEARLCLLKKVWRRMF